MNCLSPSILSADMGHLQSEIQKVDEAGAQYLHIDVMDGMFVPQISFGLPIVRAARRATEKLLDVHLMIEQPERHIDAFAKAGADIITVHAESCIHLDRAIRQIRDNGVLAAVALNPASPLTLIEYLLPELDMVLLMSVNPGYGGQQFIPYTLQKIRALRDRLNEEGLSADIEADGGIGLENAKAIMDAGANVLVAGSAVFDGDPAANVRAFLELM